MWNDRSSVVILLLALLGCGGDQGEKYLQAGFRFSVFNSMIMTGPLRTTKRPLPRGAKSAGAYNMLGMAYRFKYQQTGRPELQQK